MTRLDYWLDGGTLMGMGFLETPHVQSHKALLLVTSINQSLQMELSGQVENVSMALLDSYVPYKIVKGKDWQFFVYIPDSTLLARELRTLLMGKSSLLLHRSEEPREWLTPYISDHLDDFQAEEILHFLLREIGGIRAFPLNWSGDLGKILKILTRGYWDRLSLQSLAQEMDLSIKMLQDLFFQLSGIPLNMYLYHRRVGEAFSRINRGIEEDIACREAGLAGLKAASDYFSMNFNLDLLGILQQKPTIRFMAGSMNRLYGYRISSELSSS